MKRPATNILVVGHPVISVPLTLAGGVGLFASLYGDGGLFPAFLCGSVALAALRANEQATAYRTWKAEWDAMGDGPASRTIAPRRVVGILAVAALLLAAYTHPLLVAHWAGYALGWASQQHWLLAGVGLLVVAMLIRLIRRRPRRPMSTKPVAVIAKPILPVPSLANAYRMLPPYCHALLRGRA